ncbi:phosphoribosylanthranilate isomerase [Subsaximicrobium wynnwilliamsii]|nr:phosphoribosylanthranilate isomerase [Subsaximicrobium wynnwilliamsii]
MKTENKTIKQTSSFERQPLKLKICGMKHPENILEVAALQPDYLGFIFYEKSSRFFNDLIPKLPKSIKKVGVFVNASVEHIVEKANIHELQAIQLHGNETPEFIKELVAQMERFFEQSLTIIKAFSIGDDFDFSVLQHFEDCCNYYLFDTKGKLPGGNGYAFSWTILNNYPSTKPYFLSGGIGLEEAELLNVFLKTEAAAYCYAIDLNSKFEIEAGRKDSKTLGVFKNKLIGSN